MRIVSQSSQRTLEVAKYFEGFLLFLLVMAETVVRNATDNDYHLKEGNAGHYRLIGIIEKRTSTTVWCDTNATYREYWVGTERGKPHAIISSDDCVECSEIEIESSGNGSYRLNKTLRAPATTEALATTQGTTQAVLRHRNTCIIL